MTVDYREVVRKSVLIETDRGFLYPQDLWNMKIEDLKKLAMSLYQVIKNYKNENEIFNLSDLELPIGDLIQKKSEAEELAVLKFELVKDVLVSLVKEKQELKVKKANQIEIDKLTRYLNEKQDQELKDLSADELKQRILALQV